jgi:hypothetical protein
MVPGTTHPFLITSLGEEDKSSSEETLRSCGLAGGGEGPEDGRETICSVIACSGIGYTAVDGKSSTLLQESELTSNPKPETVMVCFLPADFPEDSSLPLSIIGVQNCASAKLLYSKKAREFS